MHLNSITVSALETVGRGCRERKRERSAGNRGRRRKLGGVSSGRSREAHRRRIDVATQPHNILREHHDVLDRSRQRRSLAQEHTTQLSERTVKTLGQGSYSFQSGCAQRLL